MTPAPQDAPHPFVDEVGDGYGAIVSEAPVVAATEWLLGALRDVAGAGLTPVLVTPDTARLTFALRRTLGAIDAVWVVHDRDGLLRDGILGRRYESLAEVRRPLHSDDIAVPAHLHDETVPRHPRLLVDVTTLHRPRSDTRLGRTAEIVVEGIAGGEIRGWGTAEPAALHWNRENLTAFVRSRMPDPTRTVFAADAATRAVGTLVATRTTAGVAETTTASIGLEGGADAFAPAVERAVTALVAVADEQQPLLGTVSGTWDRLDGTASALVHPPAAPLALLIGPRAVRDLGVDIDAVVGRFDAVVAGRRRLPALVVPFRGGSDSPWTEFLAFGSSLAPESIARAFGVPMGGAVRAS